MRISTLALAVLACAALGVQAQQVYKWTDENGRVHYGEKPPEGTKAKEVSVKTSPATVAPETAQTWKEKEADYQRRKIEREQKEQATQAESQRLTENKRRACLRARDDLDTLEAGVPVYRVNEKGERVYMEDSQRGERIADAKRRIAAACN